MSNLVYATCEQQSNQRLCCSLPSIDSIMPTLAKLSQASVAEEAIFGLTLPHTSEDRFSNV